MKQKIVMVFTVCMLIFLVAGCSKVDKEESKNDVLIEEEEIIDIQPKKKELIASASTEYNSSKERQKNIEIAANELNGTKIKPLEVFSFNLILGERTKEKGYMPAPSFLKKDGAVKVVKTLGGGICQVSSTLYMTIKDTGVEVIERHPHSKRVSYCNEEEEAMVNYGTSDLQFKNTLNTDLEIEFVIEEKESGKKKLICNLYHYV